MQIPGPTDCMLTGLCGASPDQVGPTPGMMYLAIGLIAVGVVGLWRELKGKGKGERGSGAG